MAELARRPKRPTCQHPSPASRSARAQEIGRCHVDLFLAPRIVVELHGCYFHGHDLCQPEPLLKWQKDRHKRDARRYTWFVKQHYDVIVIWECEVEREPERVRAMLRTLAEQCKLQAQR